MYPVPNDQGAYPQFETPKEAVEKLREAAKFADANGHDDEAVRLRRDADDIEYQAYLPHTHACINLVDARLSQLDDAVTRLARQDDFDDDVAKQLQTKVAELRQLFRESK